MVLVGAQNQAARKHGADAADLDEAVAGRIEALPQYLRAAAFSDAIEIVFRRVERSRRLGDWITGLTDEESCTPRRAGGSTPEEISRHADDSALRGLSQLGLTPAAAAKFGRMLEERQRPDLALMHAAWLEEEGNTGA
jgi:hypothetical protein